MQAPSSRNTLVTVPAGSVDPPRCVKEKSSTQSYTYFPFASSNARDLNKKRYGTLSPLKLDGLELIAIVDFAMHEDFSKLHALVLNLDRWEDIYLRLRGVQWRSQEDSEAHPKPFLNVKDAIRKINAAIEEEQENLPKLQVVLRGVHPSLDECIDQASKSLCRDCSEMFYQKSSILYNSGVSDTPPQRIKEDLDAMYCALSPFEEWAREFHEFQRLAEFSEAWLERNNGDDIWEWLLSDNPSYGLEEQSEYAELPPPDMSDLMESNRDGLSSEFFLDDMDLSFDESWVS